MISERAGNDGRWMEDYNVRSYEVDPSGRLSVLSVFNMLQDAASRHADSLGVSVQQLQTQEQTWVLSRMKLKMYDYPSWKDSVRVRTWPSGIRRLFALRDFELVDARDRIIGACISAWLVIGTQSRKPMRVSEFAGRLKPPVEGHVLPDVLEKLPLNPAYDQEVPLKVRYRDLDVNGHVNNVSMIEWVLESLAAETLSGGTLSELEINFLGEAFEGDKILSRCTFDESGTAAHSVIEAQSGREIARAISCWGAPGR